MKREFTKEFKRDAVSLVIDQGYSHVEAARSLDIHHALLSRWVREHILYLAVVIDFFPERLLVGV